MTKKPLHIAQKTRHEETTRLFTGIISVNARGVGYVPAEGFEQDIEISFENLNTALHGDIVEVKMLGKAPPRGTRPGTAPKGARFAGRVLRVVERAKVEFVGTLEEERGAWFLKPDDRRMYVDILIRKPSEPLQNNTKALVALTHWTDPQKNPEGEIKEIIGQKGEHNVEMHAIILAHGFATAFPSEVLAEAHALEKQRTIPQAEIARRRDFRTVPTFTIDPADAKDFDDALSVRELENGRVEVGIHIADPSFYVRPGTAIEREARKRATSIYLVDRTIPMLPEILSNDICSLNADEDKLTFSAVFTLDSAARVESRWFGETVINSNKRFTYEEAQEVLDARQGPYAEELHILNELAFKLRDKRFKEGSIAFDQDEVKFKLDAAGRPIAVYKKERLDTNLLIEDFMLLANSEVAEFVYNHAKKKGVRERAFIYRIHDTPKEDRLAELEIFLKAIGYELRSGSKGPVSAKNINALFKEIEGKPEENLIKVATIRSMAKAIYSTKNIGHFGLAFKYYTHFTSPIRRYPDILVHRILRHHLGGTRIPDHELEQYERLAIHASEREVEATEAERESIKYKQIEYMKERIGQTFAGVISGVAEWGVYVEESETKAEGLVRLRDLKDDFYMLDKKNYRVVGEKKKKIFALGDSVKIKLVAADLETRTIDWALV